MVAADILVFNIAAFISSLFVLEFGADKFVDHTAIVAKDIGISPAVIGLLTAGAEWEELSVVIVSLARKRSSLAIGNIIGAAISNILGAFSLGLLFYKGTEHLSFDKSSKIYSAVLFVLTIFVAGLTGFKAHGAWRAIGGVLIGIFLVYVGFVAWTIARGVLTAPEELSASDDSHIEANSGPIALDFENTDESIGQPNISTNDNIIDVSSSRPSFSHRSRKPRLWRDWFLLTLGFAAIVLSSYILSQSATTILDELGISDVLFGVVILSIATTIPEKFIAILGGIRGHPGILIANTVGSNIFLLSLCMGVLLISTNGAFDAGSVNDVELGVLLGSSLALNIVVWCASRWARWIGGLMLVGYLAFIILEFTVIHKV